LIVENTPNFQDVAGVLAAVAAAISAFSFAALQTVATLTAGWKEELEACQRALERDLADINNHLSHLNEEALSVPLDRDELEIQVRRRWRSIIAKSASDFVAWFDANVGLSLGALRQKIRDSAGSRLSELVEGVTFNDDFMTALGERLLAVKRLDKKLKLVKPIKDVTRNVVLASGLSVLAFCVGAVPPLPWGVDPFLILFGVALLFATYLWLTIYVLSSEALDSTQDLIGNRFLATITMGVGLALYLTFIFRATLDKLGT
jgi:hypothetical protein